MNSVSAMVTGERPLSSVRTRRTVLTFDGAGGIRIGGILQSDMAVTNFADLARDPESVVVGGRLWSPANLIAEVVNNLLESFPSTAGAVATYPACYSDKQLSLLRQALNLAGATQVLLVPEPVAAAEWLEHERGPLESGFVLVYDLGAASLDVSMVRVGPDWDDHPVVGKSVRSYDFGGRPLGSMIARYARVAEPGDNGSMLQMTSIVDITSMRAQHIRDSLDVVHECLASTGRSVSDIAYILLVGGASRPVEVARILAELGRPVVMSTDPGQTIAIGAAGYAARRFAPPSTGRHRAPRVAVFSSAAVASAVAVSAVTVFGGPSVPQGPSQVGALPEGFPMDNLLFEPHAEALDVGSAAIGWARPAAGFGYSGRAAYGIAPAAYTAPTAPSIGPSVAEAHHGKRSEQRSGTAHFGGGTYADPAQFLNPLPFIRIPQPIPAAPNQPVVVKPIPNVSLPGSVPAPANPAPAAPGGTATNPGTATPVTGGTSGVDGVPGTTAGGTSTGAGTSGGTASGGSHSGGSTRGASGGASSGTSSSTSGGSGGGTSDGSTSTGTGAGSTGGSTAGGSTNGGASGSTGGASGHSAGGRASGDLTSGGVSGPSSNGGASGHSSDGRASGDSTSGGVSGPSSNGGASGHSSDGRASGDLTSGGASGHSSNGGNSGHSAGGGASGHSSNGGASGSTGGGASGHSMSGGASEGSTSGGISGGSASGGRSDGSSSAGSTGGGTSGGSTSAGSTGGTSAGGKSAGGTASGGSTSSGGASSGGGVVPGLGGGGGAVPGLGGFGGGGAVPGLGGGGGGVVPGLGGGGGGVVPGLGGLGGGVVPGLGGLGGGVVPGLGGLGGGGGARR
ncbi:Hsp70 family protein [Nocardia sp. NPDC049707]|uniref:Hsp70 family protein n=1 Tax=Nocardia sp. NPDC049707 TaxID=3154735 RepID=UPI003431CEA3